MKLPISSWQIWLNLGNIYVCIHSEATSSLTDLRVSPRAAASSQKQTFKARHQVFSVSHPFHVLAFDSSWISILNSNRWFEPALHKIHTGSFIRDRMAMESKYPKTRTRLSSNTHLTYFFLPNLLFRNKPAQ